MAKLLLQFQRTQAPDASSGRPVRRRNHLTGDGLKTGRGRKKARRAVKPVSRKSSKAPARKRSRGAARKRRPARAKSPVSRARATKPARTTSAGRAGLRLKAKARGKGGFSLVPRKRNRPLPSPLPTKHVAPPRPVLMVPARSMPPARDQRRTAPLPGSRGPLVVPDFSEAGVLLAITYSIR